MASKNRPHEIMSGAGWLVQFAAGVIPTLAKRGMSAEEIHRLGTPEGAEDLRRGVEAFCDAVATLSLEERLAALIESGKLRVSDLFYTRIVRPGLANPMPAVPVGTPFPIPKGGMADAGIRKNLGDGHTFESGEFLAYFLDGVASGTLPEGWNLYYVWGLNDNGGREVFAVSAVRDAHDHQRHDVFADELDDHPWSAGNLAFPCSHFQS